MNNLDENLKQRKRVLQKQFIDLASECADCYKMHKEACEDTENCNENCAIQKSIKTKEKELLSLRNQKEISKVQKLLSLKLECTKENYNKIKTDELAVQEIAEVFGITPGYLAQIKRKWRKEKKIMEANKQNYKKLVSEGKNQTEIAKMFGYKNSGSLNWLKTKWEKEENSTPEVENKPAVEVLEESPVEVSKVVNKESKATISHRKTDGLNTIEYLVENINKLKKEIEELKQYINKRDYELVQQKIEYEDILKKIDNEHLEELTELELDANKKLYNNLKQQKHIKIIEKALSLYIGGDV